MPLGGTTEGAALAADESPASENTGLQTESAAGALVDQSATSAAVPIVPCELETNGITSPAHIITIAPETKGLSNTQPAKADLDARA